MPKKGHIDESIFYKKSKTPEEERQFWEAFFRKFAPRLEEREVDGRLQKVLVFDKPLDASGFIFPDIPHEPVKVFKVSIDGVDRKFCDRDDCVNFRGAVFKEDVNFEHAIFGKISFEWANFEKDANFAHAMISRDKEYQVFRKTHFGGRTYFNNATLINIGFQLTTFSGRVEFDGATFEGEGVSFFDAKFESIAAFGKTAEGKPVIFKCQANFSNAKFKEKVDFWFCKFSDANFSHCHFYETAFFDFAEFRTAIFNFAVFEKGASFKNVTFNDEAWFQEVEFKKAIEFQAAEFKGKTTFKGSVFERIAVFVNEDLTLDEPAPKFHDELSFANCDFRQGADFLGSLKNETNISTLWKFFSSRFSNPQAMIEALRIQRLSFEKEGKREEADRMFVLEMRAKRKLRMLHAKENLENANGIGGKLKAIMYYLGTWIGVQTERILADGVSEYGTNWKKTLLASIDVILWSALLYYIFSSWLSLGKIIDASGKPVTDILNHLYYSLVTFTTLGYGDMHPIGWLKALSALEALTGAVFMALIVAVIARKWMR
ncbi:pentapeptide repeat-containing protein [Thermococcus sp.]|uniref:pentapeptide repeat-containing protein n=1 Tax=Thermococcus sp. TaxID=35749 RepID=UPI0026072762|nr:pentapeptide repeat-containing protein [Thermococcus sp.]